MKKSIALSVLFTLLLTTQMRVYLVYDRELERSFTTVGVLYFDEHASGYEDELNALIIIPSIEVIWSGNFIDDIETGKSYTFYWLNGRYAVYAIPVFDREDKK